MPRVKKQQIKKQTKDKIDDKIVFETVPDENLFNVIDGSTLGNLYDLANAIELMSDDTFYYHANEGKNDFANWVNDCMGETELATSIINKSREETHTILLKRMLDEFMPKKE